MSGIIEVITQTDFYKYGDYHTRFEIWDDGSVMITYWRENDNDFEIHRVIPKEKMLELLNAYRVYFGDLDNSSIKTLYECQNILSDVAEKIKEATTKLEANQ